VPRETRTFGRTLDDTTNSYKFFWLRAMLQSAEANLERIVPLRELTAEMLVALGCMLPQATPRSVRECLPPQLSMASQWNLAVMFRRASLLLGSSRSSGVLSMPGEMRVFRI
jgi:hypothetical protein